MTPAHLRALARVAAIPALAGALLLSTAATASAHDDLIASDPASGATLDAAPAAVRLDFSAGVLTIGAAIIVADAAGTTFQEGEPVVTGSSVSMPLEQDMPDGSYEVRWRVVSADGHPISGLFPFTVGDVASAAEADTAAEAGGPEDASVGTAEDPATTGAVPAGAGSPSTVSPWRTAAVGATGAVVALGLSGLVAALRRRHRPLDVAPR